MTAQEYQEDTELQKADRASRIDGGGGTIVPYHKKLKVGHSDGGSNNEAGNSVVNGNTYVINISGEAAGGSISFLNGLNDVPGALSTFHHGATFRVGSSWPYYELRENSK